MPESLFIFDIGADGVVATHPRRAEIPILVAPVPEEQKVKNWNTVRPQLVVTGCMTVSDPGFSFDSSFPDPGVKNRMQKFAGLMNALRGQDKEHRFPPISIFGHADPFGADEYNKTLSGRRALAIYALLTRRTDIWDYLNLHPASGSLGSGGDTWGYRAIQIMLSVPLRPGEPQFYWGPYAGVKDPVIRRQTKEALNAYQSARKLPTTAVADDKTRQVLFGDYMDAICQYPSGGRFVLEAKDFLAGGADKKTFRGDVQGCSEFNPILLLSQDEERNESEGVRKGLNIRNRRVVIYIFRHETRIDPEVGKDSPTPFAWPCPSWKEGPSRCRKAFWSNHEERLQRGAERREFAKSRDTMACRFYHSLAQHSPCEAGVRLWRVRFRVDGINNQKIPLSNRRYVLQTGATDLAPILRGTTDDKGEIRIPVFDEHVMMKLKLDAWGALFDPDDAGRMPNNPPPTKHQPDEPGGGVDPGSGFDTDKFVDEDKFMQIELDAGALKEMSEGDDAAKQRLYNLGFGEGPPLSWSSQQLRTAVRQYRASHKLDNVWDQASGLNEELDDATREAIRREHEVDA